MIAKERTESELGTAEYIWTEEGVKGEENHTIFYSYHWYQLTVDVEGYFPPGHVHRHTHIPYDFPKRAIGPSQRPIPETQNIPKSKISMPPMVFVATIPAVQRPQAYALDRAGTRIGEIL